MPVNFDAANFFTRRLVDGHQPRASGETVAEIRRMGFSLVDQDEVTFDPEPAEFGQQVDWDAVDAERYALLPC